MKTPNNTSNRYLYKTHLFYALLFFAVIGFTSCNDITSSSFDVSGEAPLETPSFDALSPSASSHGKEVNKDANFPVFDEIRHFNKPNMEKYGFTPIEGIYTWNLWGGKPANIPHSQLPVHSMLVEQSQLAKDTNPHIAMIDIEHWPTSGVSPSTVKQSVMKYIKTYKRFKNQNPGMKFGYFGVAPLLSSSVKPKTKRLLQWRAANKPLQRLADKVDVFFVPAKTHWTSYQAWSQNLKLNLSQARRMAKGKPVYVVLDPQYPPKVYGAPASIHNKYVEGKFWKWQLNQARRFADGIVIWSHYGRTWDKSAPWWIQTQKFLKRLNKY